MVAPIGAAGTLLRGYPRPTSNPQISGCFSGCPGWGPAMAAWPRSRHASKSHVANKTLLLRTGFLFRGCLDSHILARMKIRYRAATFLFGAALLEASATAQAPAPIKAVAATLQLDYEAEQAAMSAFRRYPLDPKTDGERIKQTQKAQAAHLAGNLTEALELIEHGRRFGGSNIANADSDYTQGRILEALRRRAAAEAAYKSAAQSGSDEPVMVRLASEGLLRVAPPLAVVRAAALEKNGDFSGAVRAYEDALAQWPNDGLLLSELAWAAVRARDGRKGRAAAEKAIGLADSRELKAAAYYNLGRAAELLSEREAAISAYQSAVALRAPLAEGRRDYNGAPNSPLHAVGEALRKLDAPPFPATGRLLRGPFSDEGQAGIKEKPCHVQSQHAELPLPFLDVSACEGNIAYTLRVNTADGFFLLDDYLDKGRVSSELPSVTVQEGRLVVQSRRSDGRFDYNTSDFVTICAPAGRTLACVGPIEIERSYTDYEGSKSGGNNKKPEVLFKYRPRLLPGNVLSLDPVLRRRDLDLTGKWKLSFPAQSATKAP